MSNKASFQASLIALVMALASASSALEADEALSSVALEKRAVVMGEKIRCPVCGGQSINDSDAHQAKILRLAVRKGLSQGMNEDEIQYLLRQQFGDDILLHPHVGPQTFFLWAFPGIGVIILLLLLWQRLRR